MLIESIDARFGLARKKAKGGNTISSRYGDLLISDQDDVDYFVDNYPHCGQKSLDQVYFGIRPLERSSCIRESVGEFFDIILLVWINWKGFYSYKIIQGEKHVQYREECASS